MSLPWETRYEQAIELLKQSSPPTEQGIQGLQTLLTDMKDDGSDDAMRIKEQIVYQMAETFRQEGLASELTNLIRGIRGLLNYLPKAKTAKILRTLIDMLAEIPDTLPLQIQITHECIEWCKEERRIFLRQNLETRLVSLFLDNKQYSNALTLITQLLRELKRLDDKLLLIEVQLLESRAFLALRNLPRARAALTSARSSANAIYCPPLLQAALDMQSGILHAEDHDYKTAYSYFVEALESYSMQNNSVRARLALKYMLLCKIMMNQAEEVHTVTSGKLALRYPGREMDAMKAIALTYKERSLGHFQESLRSYVDVLEQDPIINMHISTLYDNLMEQNLLRLIEPFSCVQIHHIADLIGLPMVLVERKLSQMILDKKLYGILDQGAGQLILFDDRTHDAMYTHGLHTIQEMSQVVEMLYRKSARLNV